MANPRDSDGGTRWPRAHLTQLVDRARITLRLLGASRSVGRCGAMERLVAVGSWELLRPSGVVSWSDETYRLMGRPYGARVPTVSQWLDQVHPDDRARLRAWLLHAKDPEIGEIQRVRRVVGPEGADRVEVGASLLSRGRVVGFVRASSADATESARLGREISLLVRAERIAHMGGWRIDGATGDITVTRGWREVLGFVGDAPVTVEEAFAPVHPEDQRSVEQFLSRLCDGEAPAPLRYRFERAGEWRWMEVQGELAGADLTGFIQDVTEHVDVQHILEGQLGSAAGSVDGGWV